MNTSQLLLDELLVVVGSPLILFPLIAIALSWRFVKHRALYALLAFLSFAGLYDLFYSIFFHAFNSPLGPSTYPSPKFNVLAATALFAAIVGFPILWWLRKVLRNT